MSTLQRAGLVLIAAGVVWLLSAWNMDVSGDPDSITLNAGQAEASAFQARL